MYIVYILYSGSLNKYYAGQTNNITQRLLRHNSGRVKSTKHGQPWNIVKSFEVLSRSEAMRLESKIKGRGINRFLEDNTINKNNFGM